MNKFKILCLGSILSLNTCKTSNTMENQQYYSSKTNKIESKNNKKIHQKIHLFKDELHEESENNLDIYAEKDIGKKLSDNVIKYF